jgi:hypothetical protein
LCDVLLFIFLYLNLQAVQILKYPSKYQNPYNMGLHLSQLCRKPCGEDRELKKTASNPEHTQEKVFAVLNDYLGTESPLPLDLAVESLLKLLPTDAPDSEEICRFGEDCFELAEMASYKSSSQSRLAQLLEALGLSSHFTFLAKEVRILFSEL